MTTQNADQLLNTVESHTQPIQYDVNLALRYMRQHLEDNASVTADDILHVNKLPTLSSIYVLDVLLAKVPIMTQSYVEKKTAVCLS